MSGTDWESLRDAWDDEEALAQAAEALQPSAGNATQPMPAAAVEAVVAVPEEAHVAPVVPQRPAPPFPLLRSRYARMRIWLDRHAPELWVWWLFIGVPPVATLVYHFILSPEGAYGPSSSWLWIAGFVVLCFATVVLVWIGLYQIYESSCWRDRRDRRQSRLYPDDREIQEALVTWHAEYEGADDARKKDLIKGMRYYVGLLQANRRNSNIRDTVERLISDVERTERESRSRRGALYRIR